MQADQPVADGTAQFVPALDLFGEVRVFGGTIGYWLIGLHAVAGLGHHYLIKDNTLLRMLPGRG